MPAAQMNVLRSTANADVAGPLKRQAWVLGDEAVLSAQRMDSGNMILGMEAHKEGLAIIDSVSTWLRASGSFKAQGA